MKIKDYTVGIALGTDKVTVTDGVTGETKNVYASDIANFGTSGSYKALLNQGSTDAPIDTLEPSNILTGSWAYNSQGSYTFTADTAFATNVVIILGAVPDKDTVITAVRTGVDTVLVESFTAGVATDGLLADQYIEIRSFNA